MFDIIHAISIVKIIWIDVLLSGDNALVIAAACLSLPKRQRLLGMVLGAGAAIALRIICTGLVAWFLNVPYLKLIGGGALMVIAAKLLLTSDDKNSDTAKPTRVVQAVLTILVADISMSIDNVIAIAAAANGQMWLIGFGLLLSIPLVVAGASIISRILEEFPILLGAGCGLLGWISGEVIASDPVVAVYLTAPFDASWIYGSLGACLALAAGMFWRYGPSMREAH